MLSYPSSVENVSTKQQDQKRRICIIYFPFRVVVITVEPAGIPSFVYSCIDTKSPLRFVRQIAESYAWILINRTRPNDIRALFVSKQQLLKRWEDFCTLCENKTFRWLQLNSESTILVMLWYYTRVMCHVGQTQNEKDQSISKGISESIRGVSFIVHVQVLFYWTTILLLALVISLEIETKFFSSDLVLPTTCLTLREICYRLAPVQSLSLDTTGSCSLGSRPWYTSLYRLST